MECPKCHLDNQPTAKFCPRLRPELAATCRAAARAAGRPAGCASGLHGASTSGRLFSVRQLTASGRTILREVRHAATHPIPAAGAPTGCESGGLFPSGHIPGTGISAADPGATTRATRHTVPCGGSGRQPSAFT